MHLVTKHRLVIRRYGQAEIAGIASQFAAQGRQQFMAADAKWMLLRPQLLDDLETRIMAVRLNREQAAARSQTACQGREHLAGP